MANGLAEKRRGKGNSGIKDRAISDTAGIRPYKIDQAYKYLYEDFKGGAPLLVADDGGGAATTTGINVLRTARGNLFELAPIGEQTVMYPSLAATGYDFKGDDGAAGGDGFELTCGVTASSALAFTVGTHEFYMKIKVNVTDQSGLATLYAGFRLAEGYQAAITGYDTYGSIGYVRVNAATAGDISIASELDGDANAVVDTTDDFTEGTDYTFGIFVDKGGNFKYTVNGRAPTVTEALQATAGDVLVPFFRFTDHTDTPGAVLVKELEIGLQDADVR